MFTTSKTCMSSSVSEIEHTFLGVCSCFIYGQPDGHSIANTGAWLRPKEIEEVSIVIVAFDRQTREWPAGVAQHFCSQLFGEIGDDKAVLVATDGSFNGDWGYHICSNDTTITEDSGCRTVYTSSTRMEFEVIQCALGRLALLELNSNNTVIFGTDSMAVLTKIQSGNLPSGWSCFRDRYPSARFGCMYLVMLVC